MIYVGWLYRNFGYKEGSKFRKASNLGEFVRRNIEHGVREFTITKEPRYDPSDSYIPTCFLVATTTSMNDRYAAPVDTVFPSELSRRSEIWNSYITGRGCAAKVVGI